MARCGDCNRFVSLETEVSDFSIDIDDDGNVTGDVTLTRNCAECGSELQEGKCDIEGVTLSDVSEHMGEHRRVQAAKDADRTTRLAEAAPDEADQVRAEIDAEEEADEAFDLSIENEEAEVVESGSARRPVFGFHATFSVTCSCGDEFEGEAEGELAPSDFDDL